MATKLVIVESPAKAKTIGSYLGDDYEVMASIGHIRDLMPNGRSLGDEHKKKWWADFAVDVDNDFEPFYEVPAEKAAQVSKLRAALKGKDSLVLATDEDREGEAISWHLLQVLKPSKNVKVERIAFHEITRDAIRHAIANPRKIDECLVEAQETRRILDRLYGYSLSPVLWRRVTKNLSAGRVQSPAVKLIVEREIARRNFRTAEYFDLRALLKAEDTEFSADLRNVDGKRVANGSDFDDTTGQLKKDREGKVLLLDQKAAESLATAARTAEPYKVKRVEATEGVERPAAPFMTTTLQQDANRKFGYGADRTMRIAQTLYEGIDIGGETVGLITYMRTDSLSLGGEAITGIRNQIKKDYPDCLPDKPPTYASKVKNAQEAHEAIRPTDAARRPELMARFLNEDQRKLYELIWKRTIASQMKPAQVLRTEAEIGVKADGKDLAFIATGRQIKFDGFLRVYSEGRDEEAADPREKKLPRLVEGATVERLGVDAVGHSTKPPARYTDATLIKKLEEQGIGRPSTYASIISVIVDRGYVRKVAKQLVPTFRAFLAMEVLENNFAELMDLGFTARMDEALDEISEGKDESKRYLREFFLGTDTKMGLHQLVEERAKEIPYPNFIVGDHPETGEPIIVRNGKDGGSFIQLGEGDSRKFADVPEDLAPADLTLEKALELLAQRTAPAESVGTHPETGRNLLLRNKGGFYLEVERTAEEIEAKEKPIWVSVPPGSDPRQMSQEDIAFLCSLPREIGKHPEDNEPIVFRVGKFGAYLEHKAERRTVEDWTEGKTMGVDRALVVLALPKGRSARTPVAPLKEFGVLDGAAGPVKVLSGRFGPYITDGETNATLPRGTDPATLDEEQAKRILDAKRAAGPPVKRKPVRKTAAKKTATKPKAVAKKK
jgi:DNA topoisomerase-1